MKQAVLATVMAAALGLGVVAHGAATKALPLDNLGLEHLDIIVPDPAASARFYSRIFESALHQQPVRDTLRYFVLLGDLPADRQVGYIAIGAAGQRQPAIGHYSCWSRSTTGRAWRARCRVPASASPPRGQPACRPIPIVSNYSCSNRPQVWSPRLFHRRSRPNATDCSCRAVSIPCCSRLQSREVAAILPDRVRHRGRTARRRQRACLVSSGTQHSSLS